MGVKNIKILILTGIFPPDIGGPATYVHNLSIDLQKKGHEVFIITYGKTKTNYSNVHVVSRSLPFPIRLFMYTLHAIIKGMKYDVIYAQGPISSGIPALITKKILKKPFAIKIVGDFIWETAIAKKLINHSIDEFQNKKYSFKIELLRKIQSFVVKNADIVIVPSNYLKKIVNGWRVPDDKIKVIYNAIDRKKYNIPSKEKAREILGLNGLIILTIGRLVPWKGIDKLIEVHTKIKKEFENLKLIIIGDGPEMDKLKKLARSSGNNIIFTGRIDHSEIPIYLSACDIFVLNTKYEGMSHVLLEAMMIGIPIITTNAGGNSEIIKDGKNGLLFFPDNKEQLKEAIIKLLNNNELSDKFAMNSKIKIKKYEWNTLVDKTLNVLENL